MSTIHKQHNKSSILAFLNVYNVSNGPEEIIPIGVTHKSKSGLNPQKSPSRFQPKHLNRHSPAAQVFGQMFGTNAATSRRNVDPLLDLKRAHVSPQPSLSSDSGENLESPKKGRSRRKDSYLVTLNYQSPETKHLLTTNFPKNASDDLRSNKRARKTPQARKPNLYAPKKSLKKWLLDKETRQGVVAALERQKALKKEAARNGQRDANWRTGAGCWTCRIRHKSCPNDAEECSSCIRLGLFCDRSPLRPSYMVNKDASKKMKRDIKEITDMVRRGIGKEITSFLK